MIANGLGDQDNSAVIGVIEQLAQHRVTKLTAENFIGRTLQYWGGMHVISRKSGRRHRGVARIGRVASRSSWGSAARKSSSIITPMPTPPSEVVQLIKDAGSDALAVAGRCEPVLTPRRV